MSTNSRTVLSSFPPMKSNALHITIRIFVPLRPLYGVPVYSSVGGDAHIAPCGKCAGVRAGRIILPTTGRRGQHSAEAPAINIPRPSRGYFLDGRSPMLPATPHATLVRLAICIGCPTHAGISPAPFHSYIAVIPNTYAFSSA